MQHMSWLARARRPVGVASVIAVGLVVAAGCFWLFRGGSEAAPKQQHQLVSAPRTDPASPSAEPIPPDTVPSEEPSVRPQATRLKQEDLRSADRSKRQPKGVPA